MRIVFITPGTGNFYCGVCLRDHALVKALRKQGHDAFMVPMYLPLVREELTDDDAPIFFGGLNVYLQEKVPFFRSTPRWIDALLDHPFTLKLLSKLSGMTEGSELGPLTLSMLKGEEGRQSKEVWRLIDWLHQQEKPHAVILSTGLQAGLVRLLKRELNTKVICFFQGEDSFLDELGPEYSSLCWKEMAERSDEADLRFTPSHYYGKRMAAKMERSEKYFSYLPNGIESAVYKNNVSVHKKKRIIGFLARMCEQKGLHVLIEAFIELRKNKSFRDVELHIAGAQTAADMPFIEKVNKRLSTAECRESVKYFPNISLENKVRFLKKIDIFSVPAIYPEAFGLYILEALAAGVPVVQPNASAFPELIDQTQGGLLFEKENAVALAMQWADLFDDEQQRKLLAEQGQKAVQEKFSIESVADRLAEHIQNSIDKTQKMENKFV